jgi:hypothetical protein
VPYPIPYRAITPTSDECTNLLVPVCFSATHLGYASARMEPVFMMAGESAGIAAHHAIAQRASVQDISMATYARALEVAGQKLNWDVQKDRSTAAEPSSGELTYKRLLDEGDKDQNGTISRAEWVAAKPSFDWLFGIIDRSGDGQVDPAEYEEFQIYKQRNPDWMKLRKGD